jgi:hypothetical protein
MSKQKNSFTIYTAQTDENPDSRNLSLSTFGPNSRHSVNRTTSRTRESPMPSSIPNPSSLLLGLAHPVRNDENSNQLLDSYAPALRQIFQLEENPAI